MIPMSVRKSIAKYSDDDGGSGENRKWKIKAVAVMGKMLTV